MKWALCLTVLCMIFAARESRASDIQSVIGEWRISEVYCRNATSVDHSEVGTEIIIAESGVIDPLSGGKAPGKIGFREILPSHKIRNASLKKLNPAWIGKTRGDLKWISITSDGLDFMLLLILPDDSIVQFSEGDVVHRLVRKKSPNGRGKGVSPCH